MSDPAWKIMFAVAAIFNVIIGLPFLLAPAQGLAMLGFAPQPLLLFAQLAGSLILMFGVSYAKLLAVTVFALYKLDGEMSDMVFALGMGDLVFAALFLWFLFGGRRAVA